MNPVWYTLPHSVAVERSQATVVQDMNARDVWTYQLNNLSLPSSMSYQNRPITYNLLNKFLSDISPYSYIRVQLRQPYELVKRTQNFLQCNESVVEIPIVDFSLSIGANAGFIIFSYCDVWHLGFKHVVTGFCDLWPFHFGIKLGVLWCRWASRWCFLQIQLSSEGVSLRCCIL